MPDFSLKNGMPLWAKAIADERDRLREINAELVETLAIVARMKTMDEFGEELPDSEDWAITLTEVIQAARAALAKLEKEGSK